MKVELLPDGTELRKDSPSWGVPFFGDWLSFLLSRGYAVRGSIPCRDCSGEGCQHCDRGRRESLIPKQDVNNMDFLPDFDSLGYRCISCGGEYQNPALNASLIVVGCLVQTKQRVVHRAYTEEKWQIKPVMKRGLGCPACQQIWTSVVALTAKLNQQRRELGLDYAAIPYFQEKARQKTGANQGAIAACRVPCLKHRLPFCAVCNPPIDPEVRRNKVSTPNPLLPWIDISDEVREIANHNREQFQAKKRLEAGKALPGA